MNQKAELVKLLGQVQEWGADANVLWPDTEVPGIDNDEVADHLIANGVVVFSHVSLMEIEENYGPFQLQKVALFNNNHVTQEEALRFVQMGEYHPSILVISQRQWETLFLNREEG